MDKWELWQNLIALLKT